jgi:APA family basic amino acid/polyamine antiporter
MARDESAIAQPELRREVKTWGSYAWGYADVGADIYVALGLVFATAQGLVNIAFLIAGLVYVMVGLTYTELSAAYPLAGGGVVYALRGLGDFWAFLAGWSVTLAFTIDIALFALGSAGYIDTFVPQLGHIPWIIIESAVIVVLLCLINITGVRESSRLNEIAAALDITSETIIIGFGFIFAFGPSMWWGQLHTSLVHFDPSKLMLGASLAIISFVGLESISQAAQETVRPATTMPRASVALILTILIYALALSNLGLGVVPWQSYDPRTGGYGCPVHLSPNETCHVHFAHEAAPVQWLASNLPIIGSELGYAAAVLGALLLLISSNSGMYGSSRIAYSMALYQLLPRFFMKVNKRRATPVIALSIFTVIAIVELVLAGFTKDAINTLGDLYAFSAASNYTIVLVSALVLRFKDPLTPRPFLMPWNVSIHTRGRPVRVSIVQIIGIIGIFSFMVMTLLTHEYGRIYGPIWAVLGLLGYFVYRRIQRLPFPHSIKRDWPAQQLAVYRESGEEEIAEEYEESLKRAKARAPGTTSTKPESQSRPHGS